MSLEKEISNLVRIISTQCPIEDSSSLASEGVRDRKSRNLVRPHADGDLAIWSRDRGAEMRSTKRRGGGLEAIGGRRHDGDARFFFGRQATWITEGIYHKRQY
jgi:hypothetical protein